MAHVTFTALLQDFFFPCTEYLWIISHKCFVPGYTNFIIGIIDGPLELHRPLFSLDASFSLYIFSKHGLFTVNTAANIQPLRAAFLISSSLTFVVTVYIKNACKGSWLLSFPPMPPAFETPPRPEVVMETEEDEEEDFKRSSEERKY